MKKKCIVIIPALNEEKTIGSVIDAIPRRLHHDTIEVDILVINDGSTDRTEEISLKHGAHVISNNTPQGVGSAFGAGVRWALKMRADYAVNLDGDGQMNPADIPKLLDPIISGKADMVTASRFKEKNYVPEMPRVKLWGNRKVAQIVSRITGRRYYDVACGFRAYNRETLLWLNLNGKFTYTQEMFLNLANRQEIKIEEIPLRIRGERQFGKSRVASNVLRYAFRSGSIILKAFKDYQPIRFFGGIAAILLLMACILEIIFFAHFFNTGYFSGYLWAGLSGAFLFILALLCVTVMLISDTMSKIIANQEELLYYSRRAAYYSNEREDENVD